MLCQLDSWHSRGFPQGRGFSQQGKAARVPRTWRVVTVVTVIELLFFCQVSPLDVRLILYVDCTKFGVMTQKEVNDVADTVEKHLNYGAGGLGLNLFVSDAAKWALIDSIDSDDDGRWHRCDPATFVERQYFWRLAPAGLAPD